MVVDNGKCIGCGSCVETCPTHISDGSVGGHLGAELKYAGYDAVLITGRAPELCYLYIDPYKAEIRPIPEMKNAGSCKTDQVLKEKIGDNQVKILFIGPAGENLVPYEVTYGGNWTAEKVDEVGDRIFNL
jgi:aldehyde:ferredoxin oxidoreductase